MTSFCLDSFDHIILDFDGVLVETNDLKNRLLESCFASSGLALFPDDWRYLNETNGINRVERISHIIAKRQLHDSKELLHLISNNFSKELSLVKYQDYVRHKFINILLNLSGKEFSIVSAMNEDELVRVIEGLELDISFLFIYGAPSPKRDLLKKIQNIAGHKEVRFCYVGDQISDSISANEANLQFIGTNNLELRSLGFCYIE